MAGSIKPPKGFKEYVVSDMTLAGFGRKEIDLAEIEMPGLWRSGRSTAHQNHWPVP